MDHVLGQTRAIDTLQAALAGDRVHHAFIFHGPTGVGKFTTARAFGRVLLCHDPERDLVGRISACGSCESCRLLRESDAFNAGAHPDFHVIRKELARFSDNRQLRDRKQLNIPIDLLRERMLGGKSGDDRVHDAPAYRTATLRHGKVFIIDEAELLDGAGQNAMLKTLEEPPGATYIVLVTSQEHRLLPTIRSRCHRVGFAPLSDAIVSDWLKVNRTDVTDADRAWLVDFADGSIGRAALASNYDLISWGRHVEPALDAMCRGRFPVDLGAQMAELINAFAERWVKEHDNASKEAANKQAAALMWSLIAQHTRRHMAAEAAKCAGRDAGAVEAALEPWLAIIDALDEGERHLASNVNLGLVVDHVVTRLGRAHERAAPNHDRAGAAASRR